MAGDLRLLLTCVDDLVSFQVTNTVEDPTADFTRVNVPLDWKMFTINLVSLCQNLLRFKIS